MLDNKATVLSLVDSQTSFKETVLPRLSIHNRVIFHDVTSLIQPDILADLCKRQSRYDLHGSEIAESVSSSLLSSIERGDMNETHIIDFVHVTANTTFLYTFLERFYFPRTVDGPLTDRPVKQRKVVIANPDEETLLGIAQCLEVVHSHCMVIPDTTMQPWHLLYAAPVEPRLESLLEKICSEGSVTVKSLVADELKKRGLDGDPDREGKAIKRANTALKELFDFGMVNREKIKEPQQRMESFRYTLFHPWQQHHQEYSPVGLHFYKMPRPPRYKRAIVTAVSDPAEEQEPVLRQRANQRRQNHAYMRRLLEEGVQAKEVNVALMCVASTWRYWEEARETVTVEEVGYAHDAIMALLRRERPQDIGLRDRSTLSEARLYYMLALLSPQKERWAEPENYYLKCLQKAKEANDVDLQALALSGLGRVHAARSEYKEATVRFEQSERCAEACNDKSLVARISLRTGRIAAEQNGYENANTMAQRGVMLSRTTGDIVSEIKALILTGKINADQNYREQAYESYYQAQQMCRHFGYLRLYAITLSHLSVLDWNSEISQNHQRIARYMRDAVEALREVGDTRHEAHALINLTASLIVLGEYEEAYVQVIRSLQLCYEVGDRRATAFSLEEIARLGTYLGHEEEAVLLREYAHLIRQAIGSQVTPEQSTSYKSYVATSRMSLGSVTYQSIRSGIKNTSIDDAVGYALETSKRWFGTMDGDFIKVREQSIVR